MTSQYPKVLSQQSIIRMQRESFLFDAEMDFAHDFFAAAMIARREDVPYFVFELNELYADEKPKAGYREVVQHRCGSSFCQNGQGVEPFGNIRSRHQKSY